MEDGKKTVVVLVGPKGAGKSTIGQVLATESGIRVVRVEPLFLQVRDEIGQSHPDFESRGFESVFEAIREALLRNPIVCFESTGASPLFAGLLVRLQNLAEVRAVRIYAEPERCVERVKNRDLSIHIPVSDDRVREVNAVAEQVSLPWAAEIDNSVPFDKKAILAVIRALLAKRGDNG